MCRSARTANARTLVGGTAWAYDPPVSISVIDSDPTSSTYNTQIASIALPGAYDVNFIPDSSRAYVLMNDFKTVRVINTATNTVVGYFTVAGANSIAVAPNGTVYLTNGVRAPSMRSRSEARRSCDPQSCPAAVTPRWCREGPPRREVLGSPQFDVL